MGSRRRTVEANLCHLMCRIGIVFLFCMPVLRVVSAAPEQPRCGACERMFGCISFSPTAHSW